MKKTTLAAVLLAGTALATMPAKANIILFDDGSSNPDAGLRSLEDIQGAGFGNIHRLMDLHASPVEGGFMTPINQINDQAIPGSFKGSTPTLTELGWTCSTCVLFGLNVSQEGGSGLTMQSLRLTLFNETTPGVWDPVASFAYVGGPLNFSGAATDAQHGNGQGIFRFVLDANQQGEFLTAAQTYGFGLRVGIASVLGCGPGAGTGCFASDDGQDSWLAASPVPGPIVGAGIPGMIAACSAMFGLNFWRRRRNGANIPA